jgi:hypothetical protein
MKMRSWQPVLAACSLYLAQFRSIQCPEALVRLRFVPSRTGSDRARCARGPRCARHHADRRRQILVLPAAGDPAARRHSRRIATHRPDAGPGTPARRQRHRIDIHQLEPLVRRNLETHPVRDERRMQTALSRARTTVAVGLRGCRTATTHRGTRHRLIRDR